MQVVEQDVHQVWDVERKLCTDVWVSCLEALLDLNESDKFKPAIPATGGRYLLTGSISSLKLGTTIFT